MLFLIILFFATLLSITYFLWLKTWQVREGIVKPYEHHEHGDKDRYVVSSLKKFRGKVIIETKKYAHIALIYTIREWLALVKRINEYIKRRFPHIVYMTGEAGHIKKAADVRASDFIEQMKNLKKEE